MLTMTDLFCGAGGSSSGAIQVPGIEIKIASNHWDLAVETHGLNHPTADHLCANLSQVDPRYFPKTDILWASPECFTAGHLVTTVRGQVAIEDVTAGDVVLTHRGRWRSVTRVQNRTADTVIVKGHGHTGIETTANHSFWAMPSALKWRNEIRQYRREYESPRWIAAEETVEEDALWATPIAYAPRSFVDGWRLLPSTPSVFGLDSVAAWWLIGRWVGDGSLTFGRNHEVLLTCGFHESDELRARLADTGVEWAESRKRTAMVFSTGNEKARDWLHEHFGHGAALKGIPTWALTMKHIYRRALLDGYLSADGGVTQRRARISTVSRRLAVSTRLLAESLGHRVAMAHDTRTTYSIEGRTGTALMQWILHWEPALSLKRSPESFVQGEHVWSRIRSVTPARCDVTVYNIEVDEDHSYVLDGIVVKNCTNHSVARGRRRADAQPDLFGETLPDAAAERSRATMWDVPRFAEVHRYQAVIVENVVDAWHWEPFRAWLMAMGSLGYEHHVVFLNSMHAQAFGPGAPQSRDRMYVVFWRKGNQRPDIERAGAPAAVCPEHGCVRARQVWKRADREPWGRYRQQYVYICGTTGCQRIVEPAFRAAAEIIDWALLGQRIGDRAKPLAAKTLARIQAGIEKYWGPFITEHRHEYRTRDTSSPMQTVAASGNHFGLAVPVEGRDGKQAAPTDQPLRTMTTRSETALLVPTGGTWRTAAVSTDGPAPTRTTRENDGVAFTPFIAELRGGGSKHRPVTDPLCTVVANGNHHGLVTTYYGNGSTKPAGEALSTVTAVDRHALLMRNNNGGSEMTTPVTEYARTVTTHGHQSLLTGQTVDIDDVLFRMLEPREIAGAMDFPATYVILGNRREQVRQAGNAVTPPAARDLVGVVAESLHNQEAHRGGI